MMVQAQEEMGVGSTNPTDPHHTPTVIQLSTSEPQIKQKHRKTKRKDAELPQTSSPTTNIANEIVNEEMNDSLERAATTASSLEAEQESGNINMTQSKATLNQPSSIGTGSGVNKPRSDEDSLKLKELMELCTNLQNRVIDLENTKTTQAMDIDSLKRRVKKLDKKQRSRIHKLKRLYKVGLIARVDSFDEASLGNDAFKQGRIIDGIDDNEGITLVDESGNTFLSNNDGTSSRRNGCRKTKRKDDELPQTSGPTTNIANEIVNEEMNDSLERAATTASSLEAEQESGNINMTQSKATLNQPSSIGTGSGVNKPRSDEDSLKLKELMELCTNLQNRVIDLENTKTTQAMDIDSLKRRVKKLDKKKRSRTHKLKRLYKVGLIARVDSFDEASLGNDAFKQGRIINGIDDNEGITLVDESVENQGSLMIKKMTKLVVESLKEAKAEVIEGSSKRAGEELEQENAKKQKVEDDKESAELKQCLEIILGDGDDVTIDVTPLSSKSLTIVDYKIHKEEKKNHF
nr:hypothetical protein [Tanacetum cinerariifolium]